MSAVYATLLLATLSAMPDAGPLDLSKATIVTRRGAVAEAEKTAVTVLVEEAENRTGVHLTVRTDGPTTTTESGAVIVATSRLDEVAEGRDAPAEIRQSVAGLKPEGFVLGVSQGVEAGANAGRPIVWVVGADARGVLFGVGKLLRTMKMTQGALSLDPKTKVVTSPAYPIRGHQLGYRNRANSWDAWDVRQFERYIRELAIFGSNCVENIPFQDETSTSLMTVPRKVMNVQMSEICQRYDQDYWLWVPAEFDLTDSEQRAKALEENEALYQACPRLDAVFVPGGDPGENHPELVIPFMKDLSVRLARSHPKAKVWLSLQGFKGEWVDYVYRYLDKEKPDWFGGMVCGPSSPSIASTRKRLDPRYPIRHYPDLTHNVRAQYPIPWWDPALAHTLGRESINPRPLQFAEIHNAMAPLTVGFLSYSDGVHDDVNKIIWSTLAWDPETPVRAILIEYARFFFAPEIAELAADGILALEQNWIGSLRDNGGVEGTRTLWEGLEKRSPQLEKNWRWQMCLVRAVYDSYIRQRLIDESALEEEANLALADAPARGAHAAMDRALTILQRTKTDPVAPRLRKRIDELCEALFRSIGLQTSESKHQASGAERGCILDFADHPLNSRWWLEDEFASIRNLPSEPEKLARLELLRTWEHPGPGSFYDDVGNVAKSPHVVKGDLTTLGLSLGRPSIPEVLWWDEGVSRQRPAWIDVMNWPLAMRYRNLDPEADYVIRTTGLGTCLLSIDGERVAPCLDNKGIGEFKEFVVPKRHLADGELSLTFERPVENLNWRYRSRLSELWLLKK
ncbi:hypothetical protein [Singulisphaera sp. GP187]|uniref:hypothetical protein n=1 Tax=Singulisphaera sp. GP187 TaxID=1882752 RepID=UPI00094147EF|nr:hypothetical protein [Singulisphaera sp. GP187]